MQLRAVLGGNLCNWLRNFVAYLYIYNIHTHVYLIELDYNKEPQGIILYLISKVYIYIYIQEKQSGG